MDFEKQVIAMYNERIASGMDTEKAKHFTSSDFPEFDTKTFAKCTQYLLQSGYINKAYVRNFTLLQSAVDGIR